MSSLVFNHDFVLNVLHSRYSRELQATECCYLFDLEVVSLACYHMENESRNSRIVEWSPHHRN